MGRWVGGWMCEHGEVGGWVGGCVSMGRWVGGWMCGGDSIMHRVKS